MRNKYYLGVDVGASKIGIVLLSGLKKQRVKYAEAPTARNLTGLKRQILGIVNSAMENAGGKLYGLGVGIAGVVDHKTGRVVKAPHLLFINEFNVDKFFRKSAKEVRADNDVRCFLRAEAAWGVAKGRRDVAALAVGTGIGGAVMTNGKIIYGHSGSAGEFGHMVIENGKTLEELGNAKACKTSSYCNRVLGLGVANIINALNPEMVILGGGIVFSKYFHLGEVRHVARSKIISPKALKTPIVKGKLGPAGQAIGAALLFANK